MDREQEVEKMVEIAHEYSKDIANTPYYKGTRTDMEAIYDAGYRKVGEVHEPKIYAYTTPIEDPSILPPDEIQYRVGYECTICGAGQIGHILGRDKKQAIGRFKKTMMNNYCPNCGARLKEVDE